MRDNYLKLCDKNLDYITVLLDKSQDVFWVTSNDYTVQIYVSPAFSQIWGYDPSVLYENPLFWLETILVEDKLKLAATSRMPHSCVMNAYQEKYRIQRKDGEIRWIMDHTYPIFNEVGLCIGYAGMAQDITATLKLEREVQIANKFLPKLAEKMERSAFWVRDSSLVKQLYVSKGFEKIWGRSAEYLYDHPEKWMETIIDEDRGRSADTMLKTLDEKGNDSKYFDFYRIKRPTGEVRWIRDISFPIFDDETGACIGFAGIAEDITQEKLYEIELHQAKERAEIANIAKSNFIASMSHDFRTPLNGLLGMAEILRSGRCYPAQREYLDAILQAGNTLLDLVEDIINFVALDLNKLPVNNEWFNLEKLIEEIMLTISPQAHEKKVEMIFSYSEQAPKEIYGDVSRIRRILMNLVNNAVKFTNKGHVLINIEVQKKSKTKVWLQLMVEDTGIGISRENFDYIFGSFNRVDPSYKGRYKGTGLGLTIVQQFVQDLGGTIKVKSEVEQGSIFYCSIPFKMPQKKFLTGPASHYTRIKTLIIDEFTRRADTFIKQFGLKNAQILSSGEGLTAIKEAKDKQEPFQLILIDDEVQEDVIELAKQIRKEINGVLILLADKSSKKTLHKLRKSGYDDCINKPLQPLVVIKILENTTVMIDTPFNKRHTKKSQLHSRKVLLVEDDLLTQKITRWMLEELNWRVEIAGSGKQALEILDNSFDLIIMDVGLPDMDGISLAEEIRYIKPNLLETPIIALTAHVMEQDKEKCLAAGMNDFLKKPLFKQDLKKILLKFFIDD